MRYVVAKNSCRIFWGIEPFKNFSLVFGGSNLLVTSQKLLSGSYRYYLVWPLVLCKYTTFYSHSQGMK